MTDVSTLFNPRAVALVGATDKSRWSVSTFENLTRHGFRGGVHLVNPRGGIVHGHRAVARITDLPDDVDLAYVMVPTTAIMDVMRQLADKGVRAAVVLTSGFGETGEEGRLLEQEMLDFARAHGITVLGPNGNGFINAAADVTPYGLPIASPLLRGSVGMVLQSGALASAVLTLAQARRVGVSLMVSMGNESMVSMADVVRYLVDDPATSVIALFIESIRRPEEFLAVARGALAAGKPVVAIKVGRSQAGARVARAHTGSLVGDDAVVDAVFQQHGVIRVESLEDLITTAGLLAETGPLPGPRIGVVTASGGACELIADEAERLGIEIPEFAPETVARLTEVVPEFATPENPIDVTGYVLVDPLLTAKAVSIVRDDPGIDFVVMLNDLPRDEPPDVAPAREHAARISELVRGPGRPVVLMGNTLTDITPFGRSVAEGAEYPVVLGGIHHGMRGLGHALRWSELYRSRAGRAPAPVVEEIEGVAERGAAWSEHRAAALLAEHGVPVVPNELVTSADAAAAAADRVGYPVVVKLAAEGLAHKSDLGGVRLGLADANAVRRAFDDVVAAGRNAGESVAGALVQPQRERGVELIVGVVTDPVWGHVLAVGLGGVWVEVLQDSVLRVLPVDHDEVRQAISSLRGVRLLSGERGTEKADLDAVVEVVVSIARLAQRLGPELESLEINPLLVQGSQVEALDALITWRPE